MTRGLAAEDRPGAASSGSPPRIGVRKHARGRGVNMAMAGWAYEKLVERGQTWVSYTLVLDDNWPSRRTGEKLGGEVCGNYLVYRRTFGRSR